MIAQPVDLTAGAECRLCPSPDALDLDPAQFANICADAQVSAEGGRLIMTLAAKADARLTCDRTLDEFQTHICGTCRVLLRPQGEEATTDRDDFDDTLTYDSLQQPVDVAQVIRDTLMLAVPIRKIAPHAEELALQCTYGGTGEEESNLWGALRHLSTTT